MKPWNALDIDDDDEIEKLWETTVAKDFIFAIVKNKVIITPDEYWKKNGVLYDQHLCIEHILPNYLDDIMEGFYEFVCSAARVKKDLVKRGFVECAAIGNLS